MKQLNANDFYELQECPWDQSTEEFWEVLYVDSMNCEIVRCKRCGAVFAKKRLNTFGLEKYWKDYLSRVQLNDEDGVEKRNVMYKLDYEYIHNIVPNGMVLDVGCGQGSFMELFTKSGYEVQGVEFGEEAAKFASNTHDVFYGEFPKIKFDKKYDLIIFRGVLQYVPDAKKYLEKAISLLKKRGVIFITAQPNMESFCFNLFLDKFTQPVTGADFLGYTKSMLTKYFKSKGLILIEEKYFYENTPYANIEADIEKVYKAIKYRNGRKKINFKSPAFWGNMMTLVYRKIDS